MSGKKSTILITLILLGGGGIAFGLFMLKKPPPKKSGELLRSLKVLPLKRERIIPKVEEFALVRSLDKISLRAQVSGKIIFCGECADDGVNVKKGDVIIEIEQDDYKIAKHKAEAELDILKVEAGKTKKTIKDVAEMVTMLKEDYDLEKINYERSKKLYDSKVYSRSAVEHAQQVMSRRKKLYIEMSNQLSKSKFALESIKANTKKAEASLEEAQLNLKRTSIKAPIDGRIGNCNVNVGEYVAMGQEICTITDDKKPSLKVPVDATEASAVLRVKPGKKYWLETPDDVKATVAWVKKPVICKWNAVVTRIENYDSATDTLRILVTPTEYAGSWKTPFPLLPGMFCKVTFYGQPIENAFRIPFSALQFENYVFTVDNNGILHRYKVKPFAVEGAEVIILSGLPDDEQVVIQQLPRGLMHGMKVRPMLLRGE